MLLAIVLFVASAALAVGVFLYDQYLHASASSKLAQLERAKEAFEPSLIHELTRLDDRLRAASHILSGHIAPTAFFRMLEANTIATLGFTTLKFDAPDAQHMEISMNGVAQSVNAIALQADLFAKGGVITSPIFSNINRQLDGVHFDLKALLNPASVNYAQLISAAAAASQQEVLPQEPAQSVETVPPGLSPEAPPTAPPAAAQTPPPTPAQTP